RVAEPHALEPELSGVLGERTRRAVHEVLGGALDCANLVEHRLGRGLTRGDLRYDVLESHERGREPEPGEPEYRDRAEQAGKAAAGDRAGDADHHDAADDRGLQDIPGNLTQELHIRAGEGRHAPV